MIHGIILMKIILRLLIYVRKMMFCWNKNKLTDAALNIVTRSITVILVNIIGST